MKHRRHVLTAGALALFVCTATATAAVKLPNVIGSHMVLQRDMPVPIWGWAEPGEAVNVHFAGQTRTATANAQGEWMVKLDALEASAEPRAMTIVGQNKIQLDDVLVGEVWLCSGQSNMQWSVSQSAKANEEIAAAKHPNVRLFNVPRRASLTPQRDTSTSWQACSPKTVAPFSAVGYHFGRRLHQELGVPIGLIGSAWGGTKIEPWTPPSGFAAVPELKSISDDLATTDPSTPRGKAFHAAYVEAFDAWADQAKAALERGDYPPGAPSMPTRSHQSPTMIYNGMIHPLVPYAMRGAIWYQGESNGGEHMSYFHKTRALVAGWRDVFQNDKLAYYYVQLTSFRHDNKKPEGGDGWARIREAQRKALDIPHTGMAVTLDVGNDRDIHPRNKQDVGWRLAQNALAKTYGKDIVPAGPLYKAFAVQGNRVYITFDHVGDGLMVGKKDGLEPTQHDANGKLARFAIAGADQKWFWADATIEGDKVMVSHPSVPTPVAVRYAWSMNPAGANLYNKQGLPAAPFRTDDWPVAE